jgi:hypothetical protein
MELVSLQQASKSFLVLDLALAINIMFTKIRVKSTFKG